MTRGKKVQKLVQNYINRVNSVRTIKLSQEEQTNIINWFNGLDELNVFDDIIDGWTLRPSQNAGTGTRVFGFKGNIDGLMIDGPTWTGNGINFLEGSTNRIDFIGRIFPEDGGSIAILNVFVPLLPGPSGGTLYAAGGSTYEVDGCYTSAHADTINLHWFYPTTTTGFNATQTVAFNTQYFDIFAIRNGRAKFWRNGGGDVTKDDPTTTYTNNSLTGSLQVGYAIVNGQAPAANAVHTLYVAFRNWDETKFSAIFELYKRTIGRGLFDFDADAVAYFNAAGVTDANAQIQINRFIVGLKSLGLWNKLKEAWLMKSSQNAGTGTTLYGLKGLYNGVLMNGASWGTDGIVFVAVNQNYINIPTSFATEDNAAIFSCALYTTSRNYQRILDFGGIELAQTNAEGIEADWFTSPDIVAGRGVTISGLGEDVRFTAGANYTATKVDRYYNGGFKETATGSHGAPFSPTCVMATRVGDGSLAWDGVISFVSYFNTDLTDTEHSQLDVLYKTTIGQGLSLP